jgi:hypothetical protein
MKGEIKMSCPYLEKGKTAYCHAFGNQRLGVESSGVEVVCFSGEFSECSFLFVPLSVEYEKSKGQKNLVPKPFKGSFRRDKSSIKGTRIA